MHDDNPTGISGSIWGEKMSLPAELAYKINQENAANTPQSGSVATGGGSGTLFPFYPVLTLGFCAVTVYEAITHGALTNPVGIGEIIVVIAFGLLINIPIVKLFVLRLLFLAVAAIVLISAFHLRPSILAKAPLKHVATAPTHKAIKHDHQLSH